VGSPLVVKQFGGQAALAGDSTCHAVDAINMTLHAMLLSQQQQGSSMVTEGSSGVGTRGQAEPTASCNSLLGQLCRLQPCKGFIHMDTGKGGQLPILSRDLMVSKDTFFGWCKQSLSATRAPGPACGEPRAASHSAATPLACGERGRPAIRQLPHTPNPLPKEKAEGALSGGVSQLTDGFLPCMTSSMLVREARGHEAPRGLVLQPRA
jgi:hypothetical protein